MTTTVLIVEDDDAIRNNVTRLLRLEGYEILSATHGKEALELVRAAAPDVVITDISMPVMDGFELLETLRADRKWGSIPVMLLTAMDDRASMRRGMASGADDYLAKPFSRAELLEALEGLLKKRQRVAESIQSALVAHEEQLRVSFSENLGGKSTERFGLDIPPGAVADLVVDAAVLFSEVRNFTSLAERLSASEVAELLTEFFERSSRTVQRLGGQHLKFRGGGLMVIFSEALTESSIPAARRAVIAALGMTLVARDFRAWLARRFANRSLPPFAVGVGLHAGEVTLCTLGSDSHTETTPIGEAVHVASRLESSSKELGWSVVASTKLLGLAGEGIQTGGMTSLSVRDNSLYIDVAEILGMVAVPGDTSEGAEALVDRAAEVHAAVQINSQITARAVKGALSAKLSAMKELSFSPDEEPLRLKGYRIARKIGAGGMTQVYLAVREVDGLAVVLKVLEASGQGVAVHLSRFIQEYALLSGIDHPNVVKIYDQGFTDDHAYIAMEYFERGDLRAHFKEGMTPSRVIQVVAQLATALSAVHGQGIIHRDLKPENVMLRADGSVALADFGIAKPMMDNDNLELTKTRHGDVIGTPYYLSPEQAAGKPLTLHSDLYSLGVMMFEMLAGKRPFAAETLAQLLARHLHTPTPDLPARVRRYQPIVNTLMAKAPSERYANADALLAALKTLPPAA